MQNLAIHHIPKIQSFVSKEAMKGKALLHLLHSKAQCFSHHLPFKGPFTKATQFPKQSNVKQGKVMEKAGSIFFVILSTNEWKFIH